LLGVPLFAVVMRQGKFRHFARPFSVLEIPFAFSEASSADRLHFFAAVSILQL